MSKLLNQTLKTVKPYVLATGFVPAQVEHRSAAPSTIHFSNGETGIGICLRCPTTPCMTLHDHEVNSSSLADFPAEKSLQLCAAGAMSINLEVGVPIIDTERCIGCGACASRCPAGAIFISAELGATVVPLIASNREFSLAMSFDDPNFQKTFDALAGVNHTGVLADESDQLLERTTTKMALAQQNMGDRFPVHHVRNLFIALGQGASMRRKGNNHMRMDLLLGPPGIGRGLVEVEFGQQASIDAPRDVLDAIAVLQSRYGWGKDDLTSLIVTDKVPNKRSGFWNVIHDIREVTGVEIGIVTTLALHLLIWLRANFPDSDHFHIDKNSSSYRVAVLERLAGRKLNFDAAPKSTIEAAK